MFTHSSGRTECAKKLADELRCKNDFIRHFISTVSHSNDPTDMRRAATNLARNVPEWFKQ